MDQDEKKRNGGSMEMKEIKHGGNNEMKGRGIEEVMR